MTDPLAEVVALLQPSAPYSKLVSAKGPWRVRRSTAGDVFYCVVLDGACRLAAAGQPALALRKGDFVLVPSAYDLTTSSLAPPSRDTVPVAKANGEYRLGIQRGAPDVRMLIGHCTFGSPDAALLVSLLPRVVHLHDQPRLSTIVQLLRDESRERRPAREVVLARLLEVLLIEALRSTTDATSASGLLRGLADERVAVAIRRMHERPTKTWTIAQLAKDAALSRSTFFERFNSTVGVAPMEYLLGWRMALAKDLLRRQRMTIGEVAEHVGYSSASTFSVAFSRHVGTPPRLYARGLVPSANR
jgi:AraC-like DNA-binding protein